MKYLTILLFLFLPSIHAVDLDQELTDEEKETFDEMLTPVMKVYNFVKYVTTVIAALYLLFVGIQFMTAGSDQRKRDDAKSMGGYVIIGLAIIWVAPYAIAYITS